MGRGLLEQAPDVLLGTYLGAAGDPAITKVVEELRKPTLCCFLV
jgi:indolepyruvate decarboxylase